MKTEFNIYDEWIPLEIHPEIPPEGALLSKKYGKEKLMSMIEGVRAAGKPYGIEFGNLYKMSNTHLVLEAAEFAKDKGKFHEFHERIFYANFVLLKDLGDIRVIEDIAMASGLNPDELRVALKSGQYDTRLLNYASQAKGLGISATPTFIVDNKKIIQGAQPIEVFRRALKR